MDELAAAIGKLLGVFKDPVNVILLMTLATSMFGNWKLAKFLMDRYEGDVKSRSDLAAAIQAFTKQLGEIEENGR